MKLRQVERDDAYLVAIGLLRICWHFEFSRYTAHGGLNDCGGVTPLQATDRMVPQ